MGVTKREFAVDIVILLRWQRLDAGCPGCRASSHEIFGLWSRERSSRRSKSPIPSRYSSYRRRGLSRGIPLAPLGFLVVEFCVLTTYVVTLVGGLTAVPQVSIIDFAFSSMISGERGKMMALKNHHADTTLPTAREPKNLKSPPPSLERESWLCEVDMFTFFTPYQSQALSAAKRSGRTLRSRRILQQMYPNSPSIWNEENAAL